VSELEGLLEPTSDPVWLIAKQGFDPLREEIYEARFAISNGFAGVRGGRAISRGSRWIEPNRTYIAGLFDIPGPEHPIPELIPAPGWLQFRIIAAGEPLARHPAEVIAHRATLDMRRGVLLSGARLTDHQSVAVRTRALRLVSLSERAIGVHVVEVEIEQGEIELTLESSFEGLGLGLVSERVEQDFAVWRTRYSGKRLAITSASWLHIDGSELTPARPGPFAWSWHWKTRPGQVVCLSRVVAAARGDTPNADPGRIVREKLGVARQLGWRKVAQEHEAAWAERWQRSDIEVGGDPAAEQALRFAVYHLNSAANPADERVSIGARGLTGEDYHGHVFWDTEIYLLPFYTLTWPEAALPRLKCSREEKCCLI
jgi:trehalose/maltose hydrolase-like predicted phosphorylase